MIGEGTDAPDRLVLCDLMLLRREGNPRETEVDVSRPLNLLLTCF